MTNTTITWRTGWAARKLDRLPDRKRAKRVAALRAALTEVLPAGIGTDQYVVLQADLTKRGNRQFRLADLRVAAEVAASILGANCTGVVFMPTQYATPAWHGTQEEYKAHRRKVRRLARRYRRRGMAGIADGLLRSLRYHATLSVDLILGVPDITGGLDTGEPSTYQRAPADKAVANLEAVANWVSVMITAPDLAIGQTVQVLDRLDHFGTIDGNKVIRVVARRQAGVTAPVEVVVRDWGALS